MILRRLILVLVIASAAPSVYATGIGSITGWSPTVADSATGHRVRFSLEQSADRLVASSVTDIIWGIAIETTDLAQVEALVREIDTRGGTSLLVTLPEPDRVNSITYYLRTPSLIARVFVWNGTAWRALPVEVLPSTSGDLIAITVSDTNALWLPGTLAALPPDGNSALHQLGGSWVRGFLPWFVGLGLLFLASSASLVTHRSIA